MSDRCNQCGAALTERDAFCTKCGTPRNEVAAPAAPKRFCAKCGAPLSGETKFCTKCGAAVGISSSSVAENARHFLKEALAGASGSATAKAAPQARVCPAPAAKSAAGIPKGAILGGAVVVVVLVLVVAIAGFIHAAHRAKEKAAAAQAASEFERNLADLAAKANGAGQNAQKQTPTDVNKSLADLAAASNLAQKANGASPADIGKALDKFSAAGNSGAGNSVQPLTQEDVNKSLADAATVANVIWKNWDKQPADIPTNELPPGTSKISVPPGSTGGYTWNNGKVTYLWWRGGLGVHYSGGVRSYACYVLRPVHAQASPIIPVAATGNQAHDWALEYERTVGGPDADLVVRTGDINNLGFGWPQNFDPFSGQSTPIHPWPDVNRIPPQAPDGTDRIMVGSVVTKQDLSSHPGDGYSGAVGGCFCPPNFPPCEGRLLTMPQAIRLQVGALPAKINAVVLQIFADDFQAPVYHSHFQVSLNGTRIPTFEYAINSLDQSGPIGKLLTLKLLPEYWPLLKSATVKLLIDDPTTHESDGYAIDFARILVNPHKFKYQVSLSAHVTDADTHKPITGTIVTAGLTSAAADRQGKCQLQGIPAGLVVATASAPGYDENSVPVDLPVGQTGNADIQLHRHQESTAALEQSIAQTGSATIYGIHFDTGSSKLRPDSLPALNAVLGLINNHPGSRWIISGHTDNQGSDRLNIPLSKARAASVVSWLTPHGIAADRLEPEGFGASRPVADNATANGRALNRRVEVALAK